MRLIDLSQPVYHDSPNCPGHPPVISKDEINHETGNWKLEMLTIATHTGSHLDAPLHKIAGGRSIDQIPLDQFVGKAVIADLRDSKADRDIDAETLQRALPRDLSDKIVLIATGFGDKRAKTDEWLHHPARLVKSGAQFLVDAKARAVGIDHYSIGGSREPDNEHTHTVLLKAGVWVVEELKFPPEVFALPQPLDFWCLPINFPGHSGSFCRPVVVVK
jgi:arylformamidase